MDMGSVNGVVYVLCFDLVCVAWVKRYRRIVEAGYGRWDVEGGSMEEALQEVQVHK